MFSGLIFEPFGPSKPIETDTIVVACERQLLTALSTGPAVRKSVGR